LRSATFLAMASVGARASYFLIAIVQRTDDNPM